jgi:hypothetical protein
MSRGKYLSLEEARKSGKLDRFSKEHPSEGNRKLFDRLLDEMSKTIEEAGVASSPEHDENSSGTQTRQGT